MKILQLCNKPPLPAVDGGCIAMNNITQGLLDQGHEVKIISICTHKHPFVPENYNPEYLETTRFEAAYVETKVNIVDAFSNLVTSDSYNISRFFSPDFDRLLMNCLKLEKFDIVHLESLFMTPYTGTIRRFSKAKIILRSHNLEYMIWERTASNTGNVAKKLYLKHLAKQLKTYETNIINEVDGIAAISREDAKKYNDLGCNKPITTIPFGINLQNYHPSSSERNSFSVFHIGAMDWKPNTEGLLWFKEKVWKNIQNIPLHLAGRNMPNWFISPNDNNIMNHGEVESAQDFMNEHDVMIVPLFSAGGMRVKIIEGMALKKVIISTSIGAEGINCTPGKNILIADTAEAFVQQINLLKDQTELREQLAHNARELVQNEYDNGLLSQRLTDFYASVLQ